MTRYRLNQPTAYSAVPGPPINPELGEPAMTMTETKATRTPGEVWVDFSHTGNEMRLGIEVKNPPSHSHYILFMTGMGDEDQANAEYIRKAWNLHDELVAFAKDAAKWFITRPGGTGNLEARAATLLAKAEPT